MRRATKHMLLIIIVIFLIEPYIIGASYDSDDLSVFANADLTISQHATQMAYFNTSGNWIGAADETETQVSNGTWSVTWNAVSQDTDKRATVGVEIASYGSPSTVINATAWDQDTTDHIVAFSFRIGTPTEGKLFRWEFGFQDDYDWKKGVVYSSDTKLTMVYLTAADYAYIDEMFDVLAADSLLLQFIEDDADQFSGTNVIEVEMHYYTTTSMAQFNEYLLYCGFLNLFVALGMTRMWNPMSGGRRRSRRRRYRRGRRGYRPRYSRRRRRYRRYRRRRY